MVQTIKLDEIGELKFHNEKHSKYWFGGSVNIGKHTLIELDIDVDEIKKPSKKQIKNLMKFINNIDNILEKIFKHIDDKIKALNLKLNENLNLGYSSNEIYYFSAIGLKTNLEDNNEWWITLEPTGNGTSKLSFLPRFTIKNNEIRWSNFKQKTNA